MNLTGIISALLEDQGARATVDRVRARGALDVIGPAGVRPPLLAAMAGARASEGLIPEAGADGSRPLVVVTAPGEGPFPLRFWLAVIALCVVSQIVGHSSLTWSPRWISPTLVSVAILLEPVLASAGAAATIKPKG